MNVIKRNGSFESVNFDKIYNRIFNLVKLKDLSNKLNIHKICKKTIELMTDNIETTKLDLLSADICANMITLHSDYSLLGSRILISNLIKNLKVKHNTETFTEITKLINFNLPTYLNKDYLDFVFSNNLDNIINNNYNYNIDYFSFKTLERSYLINNKITKETYETVQALWLRVAITIHLKSNDTLDFKLNKIKETYNCLASGLFIHATPTLFNSGTCIQQLSSCYLLGVDDSLESIFKNYTDCAKISKWAGGIGIHVSNIRAKGQMIKSTNGASAGVIPMLQVLNSVCRYIDQGGKRRGSIAIYMEPWHGDILEFLELRKNGGNESEKCRDLFLALWICDKFMEAVLNNDKWYLMSEDQCPGLSDVYGDEFNKLYDNYVSQGKYLKEIDAKMLWNKIITSQMETGTPYILFKDHINKKTNQKNLGTIKSSNLCAEICEFSNANEYAVCNLASIAVNKFYKDGSYNYDSLKEIAKLVTYNLNNIIDINYYPTEETKKSNLKNRPIGVGIQGFADLLAIMKLPYESNEAIQLSSNIMETIYFGCLEMSCELAKKYGPYDSYFGSPISNGVFQFDMWNNKPTLWNWSSLKEDILKYGVRNSLLTALMPTASTSQILGNNECFEPFTTNLYSRLTLAGNFVVFNKHLQKDLEELNLWNDEIRNKLIASYGSIQNIDEIPDNIKQIYKTVWEIKQKAIIDHALARGPFVDQSQSMNLFFANPDSIKLTSALMYGWKNGIKTGMYYLRSQSSINTQQFTIEPNKECTMCSA